MSKNKKEKKFVSLVSAYESGAESNEESGSESDQGSTSNDKPSTVDDRDSVIIEATVDQESTEELPAVESKQSTIEDIQLDEIDENPDTAPNVDEASNSSLRNEANQDRPNISFAIEDGFPPGCELIRLPPAPQAQCSQSLQRKIVQVMDRMNHYNYSINEDIQKKKPFKNPSIYEKLIEAYGIDEYGSNFESHIEDLKSQGYMFYDELDQAQREEWARKEKEKKERTKIQMVSAVKKS